MNEGDLKEPLEVKKPEPVPDNPSLWDVVIATQQTSNYGVRLLDDAWRRYNPFSTEDSSEKFDLASLKGTRHESYAWALQGVSNLEAARRLEQIDEDERNMEVIENAPWYKEIAATLTLPFTDPTVWGAAGLSSSAAFLARTGLLAAAAPAAAISATGLVVSGLAFGAAHWAVSNYTKKQTSDVLPEATWQQMMVDTAFGMAAEFGIGKIFSKFSRGKLPESSVLDIAKEDGKQLSKRMNGEELTKKDLKRQYEEGGMQFYWENPGKLHGMLNRFTHGYLGFASYSNRIIARGGYEAQACLAEMKVLDRNTAINKAGYASQVALEARIARSVSEHVGTFEEEFAKGFEKSTIRNRNDFSLEMTKAMLSGGEHSDAGVSEAAKSILAKNSGPIEEALFNLGVTDTLRPAGESAYLQIIYDPAKIMDKNGKVNDKFFNFMSDYITSERQKKLQGLETDRINLAQKEETLLAAMEEWEMQRGSISTLSDVLLERQEAVKSYQVERKTLRAKVDEARGKLRERKEEIKEIKSKLKEAESQISGKTGEMELDVEYYKDMLKEKRAAYQESLEQYTGARADLITAKERVFSSAQKSAQEVKDEYKSLKSAIKNTKEDLQEKKSSLKRVRSKNSRTNLVDGIRDTKGRLDAQRAELRALRERMQRGVDYESAVMLGLLEEDIPNKEALFKKLDERLSGHRKQVASLKERLTKERESLSLAKRQAQLEKSLLPEARSKAVAEQKYREEQGIVAELSSGEMGYAEKLAQKIAIGREAIKGTKAEISALKGKSRLDNKEINQLRREFTKASKQYHEATAYADISDVGSIVGKIASNIINGDVEMGAITLNIPGTSKYRFRRKIKVPQLALLDFTDNNFYNTYKNYLNKAATDVEIAKQYGPSLKFRGSEAHKRLLAERSKLIKENPKLTPTIMVEYEKTTRDLESILMRLGGEVPGKYKEAGEMWWGYAAKLQRGISAATALGLNSIQVMNELSTLLFAGGLKTAINMVSPKSFGFGKLARDEMRAMRLGLHMAKTAVAKRTLRDLLHDYKQNPAKEMVASTVSGLTGAVQYANLSKLLDFIRVRGTMGVIKSNLGFTAHKAAQGKASESAMTFVRALGLSNDEIKEVGRMISEHGRVTRGYFGIEKWENQELASKVIDALNVCMIKRNTAVSKVDLPFIYEHPIMASFLQYTSWIPAFANHVVIPGIMDHNKALAMAAVGYVATDYATRNLKYLILGIDKPQEEIALEAARQNPFTGWAGEIATRSGNIYTGLSTNNYAQVARGTSPALGQAQDAARMVHALATKAIHPDQKMSNADYNAFINAVPGHTMPGLASIFKKRRGKKKVVTQYG